MSDITREDAVKWLTNLRDDCGRYQDLWHYAEALDQIIKLFDADVAPVRHGRWESYSIEPEAYDIAGVKSWAKKYRCSECGFLHTVIEDFGIYTYCPRCGARMDGGNDEID